MTNRNLELKPCPFCGGSARVEAYEPCNDYPGNAYFKWQADVSCKSCRASQPSLHEQYKTKEEAEAAAARIWNRRPEPAQAEPTLYQYRTRPTWDKHAPWMRWEECTAEAATDYRRVPVNCIWEYEVRELYTALRPSAEPVVIPEGWALVPVNPTPEMLEEIRFMDSITDNAMAARYKAMLEAAPQQKQK